MSAATAAADREVGTPPASVASEATEHWVVPLLVLIVGMFMTVLDTSIINVAIPTIQTEFGGSTSDVAWISTGYALTLGVVVPTTAWLGDRVGLDRLYTIALAVAAKVKEAGKFDMWKINPYTKVLETSIKQLTRQRDLAVEALKEMLEYAGIIEERCDSIATDKARAAIKESKK